MVADGVVPGKSSHSGLWISLWQLDAKLIRSSVPEIDIEIGERLIVVHRADIGDVQPRGLE